MESRTKFTVIANLGQNFRSSERSASESYVLCRAEAVRIVAAEVHEGLKAFVAFPVSGVSLLSLGSLSECAHSQIFNFARRVRVSDFSWFICVEVNADVVPAIFGDDAGFSADFDESPNFGGDSVVLFYIFTVHDFRKIKDGA